jgi:hypothetical protein
MEPKGHGAQPERTFAAGDDTDLVTKQNAAHGAASANSLVVVFVSEFLVAGACFHSRKRLLL